VQPPSSTYPRLWDFLGLLLRRILFYASLLLNGIRRSGDSRLRQIGFPRLKDAGVGQHETSDIQLLTAGAGEGVGSCQSQGSTRAACSATAKAKLLVQITRLATGKSVIGTQFDAMSRSPKASCTWAYVLALAGAILAGFLTDAAAQTQLPGIVVTTPSPVRRPAPAPKAAPAAATTVPAPAPAEPEPRRRPLCRLRRSRASWRKLS
jgi:hypothetical protein